VASLAQATSPTPSSTPSSAEEENAAAGAFLRLLEASDDSPHGPSIRIEKSWRTCQEDAECTRIFSPCGTADEILNRRFEADARKRWEAACGDKRIGMITTPQPVYCKQGTCAPDYRSSGLGLSLAPPRGVRVGKPTLSENLDSYAVRRALRRVHPKLRACDEAARKKDPSLNTSFTITLTLRANGEVDASSVKPRKPRKLATCVEDAVSQGRFPKTADGKSGRAEVRVGLHPPGPED
jgi:hypothetical protein